jgi:hypothetical protein
MGIMMANQRYVPVRRIMEFKEDLQVLLIACLFILLSARLELDALDYIDGRALLFLAALIFLVRPLAVLLSALDLRQRGRHAPARHRPQDASGLDRRAGEPARPRRPRVPLQGKVQGPRRLTPEVSPAADDKSPAFAPGFLFRCGRA